MKRMLVVLGAVIFAAVTQTVTADTINFLGTKSLDLADPENWSASSWTSADTLVVSTENATLPETGLYLSADMPQSAVLRFGTMPNYNVEVNFGGHSLNTATLDLGCMHPDDAYMNFYLKAIGGFTGVDAISDESMKGHIRFYDGIFKVRHYLAVHNWFPYLYVCSGAELIFEDQSRDLGIYGDAFGAQFCMDGGRFVVQNHSGADARWQRNFWWGNRDVMSTFSVLNDGEYRDDSNCPANVFGVDFTLKDAGYYETNAMAAVRNTLFAGSGNSFLITNSIFRVAQLYCGTYNVGDDRYGNEQDYNLSNGTVDFCDSVVTFAFRPGSGRTTAGMIVPSSANNNTIRFRGSKNRFTSQTFVFGGNNRLSIEGGSFDVSSAFDLVAGAGSSLVIKNADVYLGAFNMSENATDATIRIEEASRAKIDGGFRLDGVGNSLTVTDGALLTVGKNGMLLAKDGQSMAFSGSVSTGSVWFAANDGRVTFSEGASNLADLGAGWTRIAPFSFADGKTNNVLVISNATYVSRGLAYKDLLKTSEGPLSEAVPYTNCKGSRIEFRGSSPILSITDSHWSEDSGTAWYSAAFGEMINETRTGWTTAAYPLKDALRLRYVLPPSTEPYQTAPLNVTQGILVLGGNAEFEFDMSDFDWPDEKVTIPLAYNAADYSGYGDRKYINVVQLNETNRDRLPVGPDGRTSRLELAADGKTLNLVINHAKRGMTILFR